MGKVDAETACESIEPNLYKENKTPDHLFNALEIGGMIIIDDLTPEYKWPKEWKGQVDQVREYWLNHPKLAATEILLTPNSSAIIATKLIP